MDYPPDTTPRSTAWHTPWKEWGRWKGSVAAEKERWEIRNNTKQLFLRKKNAFSSIKE